MKKLPNAVKWLIIVVVLALMGWMLVKVNDRASRVKMPEPDNSLGIYRKAYAKKERPSPSFRNNDGEGRFTLYLLQ